MSDDEDWVEIRRFEDPIGAEMIRDFLDDHDIRVQLRGNPQATRMTWSQTSDVLRIVVARGDLDKAREALTAMNASDVHPFRDAAQRSSELDEIEDVDDRGPKAKTAMATLATRAAWLVLAVVAFALAVLSAR